MQKCALITPQKYLLSDLKELSPFSDHQNLPKSASSLEILDSPVTPRKDLFSQLIAADCTRTPDIKSTTYSIIEEEDSEEMVS